jgi:non-ribosomal peptide synthase protein (TIGR01720 family)
MHCVTVYEVSLPTDGAGAGPNVEGAAKRFRSMLGQSATARLHDRSGRGATVRELLLASLACALREWSGRMVTRIDLEGHGRERLFDDVDVSRTVGWFTSVFPFALAASGNDARNVLTGVQQSLSELPMAGIGYGVLREYSDDTQVRRLLRDAPPSQLCFNYLGGTGAAFATPGFAAVQGDFGPMRSAAATRAYSIEVNAWVDAGRLAVEWSYCPTLHRDETVARLADMFDSALDALLQPPAEDLEAPAVSAFPLADLGADEMSRLARMLEGRQD